ncbi:rhamnogalacturonan lyase [Pseudovirgaria hyperparasitica]|uniref:rhamnogalacturonan endolyase n=1 Tax=Pseudovirgaria hyperparasitica TaxID=470096 RepID=A0A6A6W4K6_9PEZI|nr:rhamnogalacturonan lyase [Pseudovirgaria hyperparasitica]KAF2757802.1 rhamnogalacturonan lyase [Pseudovirgaria hyperparasitica]
MTGRMNQILQFRLYLLFSAGWLLGRSTAAIIATENSFQIVLTNDRLFTTVNKSTGAIDNVFLDGQDLLGTKSYETPTPGGASGAANSGIGPYLDCYCIPSGFYTPGSIDPYYKVFTGNDSTGTMYGGIVMGEVYPPTGQRLEQYWFLRDGETGLHMFSRLEYRNTTTPFLRNLQEFRTLFRPNTPIWTHLSTNEVFYGPLPNLTHQVTVQDATWDVNNAADPYVQQIAPYFTKYTFADAWRDHDVHGIFADGSRTLNGNVYGAWLVMNTRDTYFGGPLHSDLTVDGIVYNYISSNHHGDQTPKITHGFDRTFGPSFLHFNTNITGTPLSALRADAARFATPSWNKPFYDSIAPHVSGYVPTSGRGSWTGTIDLPQGASRPIAILTASGYDFQDNVFNTSAYQYWASITPSGSVQISGVVAGLYRLTIYADGIFGQYIRDGISISAEQSTHTRARWTEESSGTELFRIGVPDKSSGEYRHGRMPSQNGTLHPPEYRIYWAAYDFPTEFPEGVQYTVGKSSLDDLNYVHWSVYGGKANALRPVPYFENVANWTILFSFNSTAEQMADATKAIFTVQLAGAKTAAGNTDVYNSSEPYADLPLTVSVNNRDIAPWVIPYYHSSSCAVRSEISCYNIAHKYEFPVSWLQDGANEFVMSLPANATDYESALLPESVYVQYDAIRLEIDSEPSRA